MIPYRNQFHTKEQRESDRAFESWFSLRYAVKRNADGTNELGRDVRTSVLVDEFLTERPKYTEHRDHLLKFFGDFLKVRLP